MNFSINIRGQNNSQTEPLKNNQKTKMLNTATGIITGIAVNEILPTPISKLFGIPVKNFYQTIKTTTDEYIKSGYEAFEQSGLTKKGVSIVNASNDNKEQIHNLVKSAHPKLWSKTPILKDIHEKYTFKPATEAIINASNALYCNNEKKIAINMKKGSFMIFHESGHGLNYNGSFLTKALCKSKKITPFIGAAAAYVGIFKQKKQDGEKPANIIDKTTDFIKEHSEKITFLGMLPVLAEEALASHKGAKLAKNTLSPKSCKNIKKINFYAWLTYLGTAVALSAGAYAGKVLSDRITKNY